MDHWSEKYLGMPYKKGEFDCADLAMLVRREVFGHTVNMPTIHGDGPFERSHTVAQYSKDLITPTEKPEDGDCVLMKVFQRLQHVGILCIIAHEQFVLHNADGVGTVRWRVRSLPTWGYVVEGYYKWI